MDNVIKKNITAAAADIRTGNGIAQSAINRLSGLISGDQYQPFADELRSLQGRDRLSNPVPGKGLEACAAKLDALAATLPDTVSDGT